MEKNNQKVDDKKSEIYQFQLYVGGNSIACLRAIQNSKRLFEKRLEGRYEIEVIDIYKQPEKAVQENIITIPTLIKKTPLPIIRITGDLSDSELVLREMLIE